MLAHDHRGDGARSIRIAVSLTYHDGTEETVFIISAGCTSETILVDDGAAGRAIERSRIRAAGVVFDFASIETAKQIAA